VIICKNCGIFLNLSQDELHRNIKMEHIRNALRRLRRSFAKSTLRKTGVQSARVSFPDKQTFLEYDSSAISSYQIKDAVEKAGFEIVTA